MTGNKVVIFMATKFLIPPSPNYSASDQDIFHFLLNFLVRREVTLTKQLLWLLMNQMVSENQRCEPDE